MLCSISLIISILLSVNVFTLDLRQSDEQGSGSDTYSIQIEKHPDNSYNPLIDIYRFIRLNRVDQIRHIIIVYYSTDKDVQSIVKFMQSDEFRKLMEQMQQIPEVVRIVDFIESSKFKIQEIFEEIDELFGVTELSQNIDNKNYFISHLHTYPLPESMDSGLDGFVEAILSVLPIDLFIEEFFHRLETHKGFSNFIDKFGSQQFDILYNSLTKSSKFKFILHRLKERKLDIVRIKNTLRDFILGRFTK